VVLQVLDDHPCANHHPSNLCNFPVQTSSHFGGILQAQDMPNHWMLAILLLCAPDHYSKTASRADPHLRVTRIRLCARVETKGSHVRDRLPSGWLQSQCLLRHCDYHDSDTTTDVRFLLLPWTW